jgi:hypothetical protein
MSAPRYGHAAAALPSTTSATAMNASFELAKVFILASCLLRQAERLSRLLL